MSKSVAALLVLAGFLAVTDFADAQNCRNGQCHAMPYAGAVHYQAGRIVSGYYVPKVSHRHATSCQCSVCCKPTPKPAECTEWETTGEVKAKVIYELTKQTRTCKKWVKDAACKRCIEVEVTEERWVWVKKCE